MNSILTEQPMMSKKAASVRSYLAQVREAAVLIVRFQILAVGAFVCPQVSTHTRESICFHHPDSSILNQTVPCRYICYLASLCSFLFTHVFGIPLLWAWFRPLE